MTKKLTNEDIVQKIHGLVGDEYTKLDDVYKGNKIKFTIRHNTCGNEYEVSWTHFQNSRRCPKCKGKNIKKKLALTNSNIIERMYELVGDEYSKLDDIYINAQTKFSIKHNICGHEYEVCWNKFQIGKRCPKCMGNYRYKDSEITDIVFELTGGEYTKLGKYVGAHSKFKIKHNTCGHEYEVAWTHFQQGKRCPKCNQSKGEKFISDYLANKHISFTTQVKFDDCKHERTLPFDFGIVDSNKKIIALIEFDGQQHFESVELWGGEEALALTQLRDQIKNQYCKENNIPLLRIKYNEDIQERLDNFLVSLFSY